MRIIKDISTILICLHCSKSVLCGLLNLFQEVCADIPFKAGVTMDGLTMAVGKDLFESHTSISAKALLYVYVLG